MIKVSIVDGDGDQVFRETLQYRKDPDTPLVLNLHTWGHIEIPSEQITVPAPRLGETVTITITNKTLPRD